MLGVAAALLGPAAPAMATTWLVNVGGSGAPLSFTPQSLTIAPGDSVLFVNRGGVHNVVADDNSFRCARGCKGDAQGNTGAPSGSNWVVSLTFADPGTVGYFCEVHGAPGEGMYGTIEVVAPPPPHPVPALRAIGLLVLVLALTCGAVGVLLRRPHKHR
jgi:plastocyanin